MRGIIIIIMFCFITKYGCSQQKFLFVEISHKSDYILINKCFFISLDQKDINLINLFCDTESFLEIIESFDKRIFYDEDFLYIKNLPQDSIEKIKSSIEKIRNTSPSLHINNGLTSFHFQICEANLKMSNLIFSKAVPVPEFKIENGQLNYTKKEINEFNVLVSYEESLPK